MNDGSSAEPSISDFVQMRAWKQALFTTYTLSLSYFESEILRPLLRAGCSDIWLIADAEGYRSSLLERRSMRVGQEYRLVPAALPDGVFHAKCIYLAADEGDLLLVGSGNVTFGGHGKNAEVFEALSPDAAATAFRDFADFLEAIGSRPDIRIARSEWVYEFAARARLAADGGSDAGGAPALRLIHPLAEPVIDQLPGLLAPYGACTEAIIMSPYHDHDGYAVRELSSRLDIPRSCVAVPSTGASPFPFDDAASWARAVLPVRPSRDDRRFVHAKWYEFQMDERRLLLTGSINATRKALTTTDNVELGVVRLLVPGAAPLVWEPADRPPFAPQERMPSGLKGNEIVYASFDRHDASVLAGTLISLKPTGGVWSGRLIQADGDVVSFEVTVEEDGSFSIRSSALEVFYELPALQIVMTMGEREARGWVHNEMFLSVSGRRRLSPGALSRLMRREGSDEDIEALLDYLSMQAEHHLRMFDCPVENHAEDSEDDGSEKPVIVNLADLAPGTDGSPTAPAAGSSPSTPGHFDAAMTRLRRMLLGHGRASTIAAQSAGDFMLADEDDPESGRKKETTPEERANRIGLVDFEREMDRLIKDANDKPEIVRGLLTMALEVGMWMRIYRLNDRDSAHEFLHAWFLKACRLAKSDPVRLTSLQQHIFTAASVLYRLAGGGNEASKLAAELHDSLEYYCGGSVDRGHAFRSLIPDVRAGFAELIAGVSDEAELAEALSAILSQPTTRQQLADALALAAQGKPIPAKWEIFASPVGTDLHRALSSAEWQRKVRSAAKGAKACAFDYFRFSVSESGQYNRLRIGRCIHCKRFTVNVHP